MGRVIDIFSRCELEKDSNCKYDSCDCQFKEYDPEMPIALELFVGLDKSVLIDGRWVPLSWDEKGIVVLVDNSSDMKKRVDRWW